MVAADLGGALKAPAIGGYSVLSHGREKPRSFVHRQPLDWREYAFYASASLVHMSYSPY